MNNAQLVVDGGRLMVSSLASPVLLLRYFFEWKKRNADCDVRHGRRSRSIPNTVRGPHQGNLERNPGVIGHARFTHRKRTLPRGGEMEERGRKEGGQQGRGGVVDESRRRWLIMGRDMGAFIRREGPGYIVFYR
jgi:hypothetical protein